MHTYCRRSYHQYKHEGLRDIQARIIPSSRIKSLLCRTIARANARICRWPTDKLPPPLAIRLSSVMRPSPASPCSENRPAARSASCSTASSCAPNGSRFSRRVPLRSSGCAAGVRGRYEWGEWFVISGGEWGGGEGVGRTDCGMIVILERRAGRLMLSVARPS